MINTFEFKNLTNWTKIGVCLNKPQNRTNLLHFFSVRSNSNIFVNEWITFWVKSSKYEWNHRSFYFIQRSLTFIVHRRHFIGHPRLASKYKLNHKFCISFIHKNSKHFRQANKKNQATQFLLMTITTTSVHLYTHGQIYMADFVMSTPLAS